MSTDTRTAAAPEIDYPDSDGQPMADNTLQYRWIVTIQGGLDALFRHDPNVFVAGDLLWYPVEGDNKTRMAPDVMVIFGRPKDDYRGSYMQWREGGVAPQVVFEVLSPGNDAPEMANKRRFYERYGVEEYYEFDPEDVILRGWTRREGSLVAIEEPSGWVSPRLGIRFEVGDDLTIYRPDGRRFITFRENEERADESEKRADQAVQHATEAEARAEEEQRLRVEAEARAEEARRQLVEAEVQAEEARRQRAESDQQAEEARRHLAEEARRSERRAARLRELGLDPDE